MAKKILLIRLARPSYELTVVPPLGVMYLAAALRSWGGHQVALYDMKIEGDSIEKVVRFAKEYAPDVIGLSLMSYEAPVFEKLAPALKSTLPGVFIVAGGAHVSTSPEDVAANPCVDICVLGEGERTLCTILERLTDGGSLEGIEGTAQRHEGKIVINPLENFIKDLDNLPMPAWDLIPVEKYFDLPRMGNIYCHKEYMPIFTSRSCPYQCIYCHKIFGKGFRPRSPDSVLAEIKYLISKYGIREFMIMDDCFNLHKSRAKEILARIAAITPPIALRFPNAMRADRLDDDVLQALKDANTFHTCYAIETGSKRLQKFIHKNLDIDHVFNIIDKTQKLGILTHGFFMIGFPTEERHEMLETVDFAKRSKLHTAAMFRVTPFKGTKLFDISKEMGFSVPDDPDSFEVYTTHINLSNVEEKEVTRIQNSFYREFYLNPNRLWRFTKALPNKIETLPRLTKIFFSRAFK